MQYFNTRGITNKSIFSNKFPRCIEVLYFSFTGWLYDALQSYNPGFYVSGFTIAISGIMLFFIPSLQRYVMQRRISESSEKSLIYQNGNATHTAA
jgi:hypothetical protein